MRITQSTTHILKEKKKGCVFLFLACCKPGLPFVPGCIFVQPDAGHHSPSGPPRSARIPWIFSEYVFERALFLSSNFFLPSIFSLAKCPNPRYLRLCPLLPTSLLHTRQVARNSLQSEVVLQPNKPQRQQIILSNLFFPPFFCYPPPSQTAIF